jgi:hypothetical protein
VSASLDKGLALDQVVQLRVSCFIGLVLFNGGSDDIAELSAIEELSGEHEDLVGLLVEHFEDEEVNESGQLGVSS